MITDGLWDAYDDFHMGMAELVAEKYHITRQRQDEYGRKPSPRPRGHQEWPLQRPDCARRDRAEEGEPVQFATDESPRSDTSLEALAKLRPPSSRRQRHRWERSGHEDGAAALVVTSLEKARELGKTPLARVVGQAVSGVEPKWVMMAPVDAVRMLLKSWTGKPRT